MVGADADTAALSTQKIDRAPRRLVVVEDCAAPAVSEVYAALASDELLQCRRVGWDVDTLATLGTDEDDLVVVVAGLGAGPAATALEWLRARRLAVPTFAVVPPDADEALLRLASAVTDDFMLAPVRAAELRNRVRRLLGSGRAVLAAARRQLMEEMGLTQLVGRDPAFVRAVEHLPRFARTDLPVLITGETGTGKELCARAVHHLGSRKAQPFIAVDCGAIPDSLFESELYGHVRGAFTDAHRDHKGLVAMAEGGTLFLDEIDALSLAAQAKLLRFLQEHTFRALGADRFSRADVRVIAATNRDLDVCLRERRFRADLYFRLNVLRVHLPPLRARRGDVEMLACHLLQECRAAFPAAPSAFTPAAIRMLMMHDWPGNVRELSNVVQRAAVACDGERILPAHVELEGAQPVRARETADESFRTARATVVAAFERRYLEELLQKHHGNVTHAAREAQQERRAFGRLIKKHRITRYAV